MAESHQPSESAPFRDQTWATKWLLGAGAILLIWNSPRFLDLGWLFQWPVLSFLLGTSLALQLVFLLFPLLTRDKGSARRIAIPGFKRCLVELAIAIPILIVTLTALGAASYLIGVLFPGKTLASKAVTDMAWWPPRIIYPTLLISFTLAPVAEEVFFRGFLYNAFRRRMPTIAAVFAQSLIFGFCHFFGTVHAIYSVALGMLFTFVYEWRKTLVSPILLHAGINFLFAINMLGMMIQIADRPAMGVIGDSNDAECIVRSVLPGSGASHAGIQVGDRIVAVDGKLVADFPGFVAAVSTRHPGDTATLELVRDEQTLVIEVTLGRYGDLQQPP